MIEPITVMPQVMPCARPGCRLPAEYERLATDANTMGFNLNETGGRIERLCIVHAAEVRLYLGGRLWRLDEPA